MKRFIILLFLAFAPSAWSQVTGLGHSTLTCLDRDGDGYGVGPGCTGPDADDTDPQIQTGAQCISAYGTLAACIAHLGREASQQPGWAAADQAAVLAGYTSPTKVLYLAPSTAVPAGNDSNACTSAAPCLTQTGLSAAGYSTAGVMIIMRQGWNGELTPVAGSSSIANVIMSYPGEQAVIDATAPNTNYGIGFLNIGSYVVIDGVKFQNGGGINGGTYGGTTSQCSHVIFRNIDGGGTGGGSGNGAIQMFNGLSYLTVELYVGHDDTNQHGIYMGSREIASDHVVLRKMLLFKNNWNGMHWNGRCTNCTFTQITSYNAGIAGLSFQEGLQNSTVSDILTFNTGSAGIDLDDYNGTGAGTCSPQGIGDVCPYNQTGNTFENITIYSTGQDGSGNSTSTNPTGITIGRQNGTNCNTTECLASGFGSNTFRNLIIVPWGVNNTNPAIIIKDDTGGCGTACQGWISSSTFTGIVSKQNDGHNGAAVFSFGGSLYTCTTAISAGYPITGTCLGQTDPIFVNANASYASTPSSFNFGLTSGSPARLAGTPTGAPTYDNQGHFLNHTTPSLGAFEYLPFAQGWTDLGSLSQLHQACPANGYNNGTTLNGVTQDNYAWADNCAGIVNAWGGGAADTTRNRLLLYGGGHVTYHGNEVYALNLAESPVVMTRLSNPSVVNTTASSDCSSTGKQPSDGTIPSYHSYNSSVYLPTSDTFWHSLGQGNYCATYPGPNQRTWGFSLSTNAWTDLNPTGLDMTTSNDQEAHCVRDDANGRVVCYVSLFSASYAYSISGNSWSALTATGSSTMSYHMTPALDTNRQLFISVGNTGLPTGSGMNIMSFSTASGSNYTVTDRTSSLVGCSALTALINGTQGYPGVVYDPTIDRIVIYPYTGNTLYTFNPDTNTCAPLTYSNGPTTPHNSGMLSKMQFFPDLNAYALVQESSTADAFALNFSAGGQTSTGGTAPTIITTSLPSGTAGVPYYQTLQASGSAPITWSVVLGTFPAWATLVPSTGVISGTPTVGTSLFSVQASNAYGNATQGLSITINPVGAETNLQGLGLRGVVVK